MTINNSLSSAVTYRYFRVKVTDVDPLFYADGKPAPTNIMEFELWGYEANGGIPNTPEIGGTVSITGVTKYGNVLTADISGLTYTPTTTSDVPTYQWYRGNTVIPGATSSTYTLVQGISVRNLKLQSVQMERMRQEV